MKKLRKFVTDNGLLLTFVSLFVAFFIGQTFAGVMAYNHTRANHGLAAVGYWRYVRSGNFLEGVFSNWQAALLQLGALILFAVFLRTRGAAHSIKPEKSAKQQRTKERRKSTSRSGRTQGWLYRNSLSIAFMTLFAVCFLLDLLSGTAAYDEHRALTHRPPVPVGALFVSPRFWFATMQTWQAE